MEYVQRGAPGPAGCSVDIAQLIEVERLIGSLGSLGTRSK